MRDRLPWWILAGLLAGMVVGVAISAAEVPIAATRASSSGLEQLASGLVHFNSLLADLFLRGLRGIAVPIVLFSLITGAASLADTTRLSRLGTRTLGLYLMTTALAVTIGLTLANLTRPGTWITTEVRDKLATAGAKAAAQKLQDAKGAPDVWSTLLEVIPENPFAALAQAEMLQVVVIALAIGLVTARLAPEKSRAILVVCDGLNDVTMRLVDVLMLFAPVAVFALMARTMATLGVEVLGALAIYSGTVILGLALMTFGVYAAMLRALTPVTLRRFYWAIAPAQLLAFTSSSSNATLPVTLECVQERLGVDEEVASFVIPLGATMNMDGTALYQGVAAVFIAQLYGLPLTVGDQITIVLTATLASVATAGVPGVGLVMLVTVLQSIDVPPGAMAGGIAIILGVDRILDMLRTVTNITGDCVVAAILGHHEDRSRS